MSQKKTIFQHGMLPWPALAGYGKQRKLEDPDLALFYFEAGELHHENLLLIHGLGDEADTWRHIFLPLSGKYHTIALDLPGFGRSDKPHLDYTPEFMINAIIGLMDQANMNSGILMGSSLGGILAHQLALTHTDRVTGLVLVGGSLYQPEPMGDLSLRMMSLPVIGEWLYTRLRKNPEAAYETLNAVYHQLKELPEGDQSFLYTRVNQRVWDDGQRRAYLSTLRNLAPWIKRIQPDLPAQLKTLDVPTLVIRGEFDQLFPEKNADAVVETQPNAIKGVIKNSGHLPQQENPESFLHRVTDWLLNNF